MSDHKCTKCKIPKYGYTDGRHSIFLCFKCGRFDTDGFDDDIIELFKENPMLLLKLIEEGHLKSLTKKTPKDEDYK